MSAAAEITVERLRVNRPGLVPRVEDALRVSSKPPALLNRYVLVRRLRLRAAASASAQSLALELERAWRQIAAQAEPMETAGEAAKAVWAPSAAAARQMLLRRWLRGEVGEAAWFWQRLAPRAAAGAAWPVRAAALMLSEDVLETATGLASHKPALEVRTLLAVIAAHGAAAEFVAGIAEADAVALLRVLEPGLEEEHARPWRWQGRALAVSAKASFATAAQRRLFELMQFLAGASHAEQRPASVHAPEDLPAPTMAARPDANAPVPASAEAQIASTAVPPETQLPAAAAAPALLTHGLASPWSGLWLLLPILLRHGIEDADDPLAAWAGAMQAACRQFRIPGEDAIHAALAELALPPAESAWLRVARLAAVHDARLPLLRIARRRGAAWVSPERIDVEFSQDAVDLRIRRAGFDIDPGFVPWLGRIVHFHYPS